MDRHALYPGSFDPVTLGHLDIVTRAAGLFDKVTVAVARSGKAGLLGIDQRVALFRDSVRGLANVEVEPFSGLLVDEVARIGADVVIRGIRSQGDYEHEWSLAGVNALLASDIEYIYLLARPSLAVISSTLVRDVIRHKGPLEKLVPPAVIKAVADRNS